MSGLDEGERAALVCLLMNRPRGTKESEIVADVVACGSALKVWHDLSPDTLLPQPGVPDPLDVAAEQVATWTADGLTLLTVLDRQYPSHLRGIYDAPSVLFARGLVISDDFAISVVGSRKASERGLSIAAAIAHELVNINVTVVSGLAAGIDTAAHRAALDSGGRTVAMIGTGIRHAYPAENRVLHEEIADRGLLLSQFWPDATARKHTFLMRNATMSGYGRATVVVEAGEHSGARAQARMAIEHGRPVILTDLVVDRNEWAKALIGRPGVHVAHGLSEVVPIILQLQRDQSCIESELNRLVSA